MTPFDTRFAEEPVEVTTSTIGLDTIIVPLEPKLEISANETGIWYTVPVLR
jgi:hypothetical protein